MKKINKLFLGLAIAIVLTLAVFTCVLTKQNEFALAEDTQPIQETTTEPEKTFFDFFNLSQEGHNFTQDNFVKYVIYTDAQDTIVTNKTVSLSLKENLKNNDELYIFIDGQPTSLDTEINGKKYHIFDISTLLEDKSYQISITLIIHNPYVPSPNYTATTQYQFAFNLIQTKNSFVNNNDLYWQHPVTTTTEKIKAPINNQTYSPLTLSIPQGTTLNPVFVKFNFLGQNYEIYNIGGNFFNSLNGTPLEFSKVLFNQSGIYSVEIFDRTHFSYPNANYLTYDFSIKNTENRIEAFYLHAHDEEGNTLVHSQTSNNTIIVDLANINDVIRNIDRVIVRKSWKPSGGENITDQTEYEANIPNSLTFSEDGTYHIEVLNTSGIKIKELEFSIVKSIRTHFETNGTVYEVGSSEPSNTAKDFTITTNVEDLFYGTIEGKSTYTFDVTIARSQPSIDGIAQNARTQSNVSLIIRGVGNIQVSVTKDSVTSNYVVQNGQRLPTLSEPGKYFVVITDEMGSTITKSFSISVKMNTASVILIVIAIVTAVIFIVVIIISRSKVKVR